MEKFTILCGMRNFTDAEDFMGDVLIQLRKDEIYPVKCDWKKLVVETKYTRFAFIYDISEQPLNGVEAVAIFGQEPYKQKLAPYLKTGQAYKMGDGLVDYICKMEVEGKIREANEAYEKAIKEYTKIPFDSWNDIPKQMYITSARHNGKSEFQRCYERYYKNLEEESDYINHDIDSTQWLKLNHVYGKSLYTDPKLPSIKNVVFNNPATIVFWADGTKTVVECQDEPYDPEKGLAMAMCKKMLGNKRDYYHTFKHWLKRLKEK